MKINPLTLTSIRNDISATAAINTNFDEVQLEFENTLSLDGSTPNSMLADFDMNSHKILNLPTPIDPTDVVRLQDMEDAIENLALTPGLVPVGGTVDQVLTKLSSTDYDYSWQDVAAIVGDAVTSVNTQTGAVVLNAGHIGSTATGDVAATNVQSAIAELASEKLATSSYTAADVLSKLLTVDGAGSLLDADTLDGFSSGTFQVADSDLTTIAGLTATSDNFMQAKASAWASRTVAQVLVDLAAPGTTFQPLDADLTALAALAATGGMLARTGAGAFAVRTLLGTAGQITMTNGDGVAGAPTVSLPADVLIPTILTIPNAGLHILDTNASHDLILSPGSDLTADRILTINTGDAARTLDISAGSVTISAAAATVLDDASVAAMLTTLGGQSLDATLTALAAYNTNGLLTQTAADTFTGRTITAGAGIAVTNGSGVSGNPTVAADLGLRTIYIPASAMTSRTTNGAASGSIEKATNKNMFVTKDFDTTTQEFVQFSFMFPESWDEGTVSFVPVWSHAATTVNFGVAFGLAGVAISNDDAGDVAFGTAQTSVDTGGTTDDIYMGPASAAITIAGTPAAGDLVDFQLNRTVADAGDTMAIDARLHGIKILYTETALKDAS